jgi:hypothetical protein
MNNLKLIDLKTLRKLYENTIETLTDKGINNDLLITLDVLRENTNNLIDELENIETLNKDEKFAQAVKNAIDELDNIDLTDLDDYTETLSGLTDSDDIDINNIQTAIDELKESIENAMPKELTDKQRDNTDLDDLLKVLINE